MNYTELNKKIAVFIGGELIVSPFKAEVYCFPEHYNLSTSRVEEMLFHKDWNWLMIAIHYIKCFVDEHCYMKEYSGNFRELIDPYNSSIEQCYEGVLEFIEYYDKVSKD